MGACGHRDGARARCAARVAGREAGRLTSAPGGTRISRALLFQGDTVAVHELTRSGPAERAVRDDRPPQDVACTTMLVTRTGCATLTRAGRTARHVVADPVRVVFLSAGDTYRVHYPAGGAYRATIVTFAGDVVPRACDAVAASAQLLLQMHACRSALLGSPATHAPTTGIEATSLSLAALATTADDAAAQKPAHRDLAERACAMLAASPGDAHRLPDVARALGVSPFFLARVFRAQIGVSVHQYLVRLRLGVALERIAAGERNLSTLAVSLGFATHSHFTAAFTRAYDTSPRAVRATLAGGRTGTTF